MGYKKRRCVTALLLVAVMLFTNVAHHVPVAYANPEDVTAEADEATVYSDDDTTEAKDDTAEAKDDTTEAKDNATEAGDNTTEAGGGIEKTELRYGEDFKLGSEGTMYWDDNGGTLYHNGSAGAVSVLSGNYTEYRYHFSGDDYPEEFTVIGDNETIALDGVDSDVLYLQMRNTDPASPRFGTKEDIRIVADKTAPTLLIYKNDECIDTTTQVQLQIKNGDRLRIVAADTDGSGIARLCYMREEADASETVLAQNAGKSVEEELQLEDGVYDSLIVRAKDNVGEEVSVSLNLLVDTAAPEIMIEAGKDAETYAGDGIYISSAEAEALSVTYRDANLDVESIRADAAAEEINRPAGIDERPYVVTYKVSGSGRLTFSAKDSCGNEAVVESPYVILDEAAPVFAEASVLLHDLLDIASPYGGQYDPAAVNMPLLDFDITEEHLLKVEVSLGSSENCITLEPAASENHVYSYRDVDLSGLETVVEGTLKIIAYDKAMHKTEYTYGKKVTYIKDAAVLSEPVFTNRTVNRAGRTYLVTENGQADIRFELAVKDLVPELLELCLFRVDANGVETKVAGFHAGGEHNLTISGGAGAWVVSGSYTFDSSQDGGYILKAYYTDIAQDRIISAVGTTVYYLDMTPVQLSVSSPQIPDGTITNQAVMVVYTMRELNPEFSQFSFTYTSTTNSSLHNVADVTLVKPDGSEEDIPISELAARINTPSAWSTKGGVYTLTLIYKEDSAYYTRLTVRDVMDSEAASDFRFRVDKTAPAITDVDIKTAYEDKNKSDYSSFDNSAAEVLVQVQEAIASAENMSITCVARDDVTGETETIALGAPKRERDVFTYNFTIKKDFKGTIHFTMQDEVNQSDTMQLRLANGIIIESPKTHKEFSEFSITENGKPNDNGFYNDAISLKLSASDRYSGMKSIEYSLNGKTSHVDFSENKSIKTSWEKNPVYIEAEKENEGSSVKASMKIVDNAGHEDTVEKTFKLDYTKPQILVSFDNNNSRNEKYYNQNRTATLTINELNYSSENTKVTLTKDGITQDITAAFHTDGTVQTMKDGTKYKEYIMPLRFEEDGEYTFRVETIDLAGNKGVYVQEQSFIIDKTVPVMELTYDNNSPYEENYYSRGRTATLTVTEHNFQPSDIQVSVDARMDGAEITAPAISAFTTAGDVHTARISFANEGDYTISVSGTDMAGNTARDIGQQQFTVDLTVPEILISGVEENTSYNAKAAPIVTVTDGNYDAENVVIEIIGGRNGQVKDITPVVTAAEHGQSYTYPDLQYVESRDDCYVIKATATDKAGHQAEASVNYRVNRFGSTYTLNPSLQRLVENYYGHAADDFSIIETNVDRLESYEVSYTLDNEIVNLVEGVDYEVVQSANQNQWQQYEYQFHASGFAREGVYVLSVSSVDAAGNVTDNKAKNVMLEFCIDNTAPSCIISGVSEGQRFAEDEEFHIGVEVYDNISVDTVSVRVNGVEKYTQADMTDGRLSEIAIDRDIQEQMIEVVCTDPAGNERTEAVRFIYEGGKPASVLGVPGKGMWWLWLLPVCGLAGVFIFLARKRKKEDSSAE